jgi:hypothetical protein
MATPLLPTINFLRRKRLRLQVLQQRDKLFLWGAGVFLGVTFVVLIALGGFWLWYRQQVQELQERQQQGERIVRQLAQEEAEYLLFTKRLDLLSGIFSTRISQQKTLEFLTELNTSGVLFQGITYDPVRRAVSFQATAVDITRFDAFLTVLRSPEIQQQIANLSVSRVGRNETGEYSMEVSFQLMQPT